MKFLKNWRIKRRQKATRKRLKEQHDKYHGRRSNLPKGNWYDPTSN